MKAVSFIIKRVVMFTFVLALVSLLPLQNNILSNNTVVAQAADTRNQKTSDARLTYTTMKLVVGKERVLSVRNLDRDAGEYAVFKSSDSSLVSIKKDTDSKATIVAEAVTKQSEDAVITVAIKDAKKRTIKTLECSVTVGPPAQSVKFTETEATISLSDESAATLKAYILPGTTQEKPKVTVSKDDIILVSDEASVSKGIATITVKGLTEGKVVLTLSIENGATDSCTIQVIQ